MSRRQNPNDFLKQIIGRPVVVKLNSGVDYRQGRICCKRKLDFLADNTLITEKDIRYNILSPD